MEKTLFAFLRKQSGLSQKDVAERLGIKQISVSGWETGKTKPSKKRLVDIANLFGMDYDEFIKGDYFSVATVPTNASGSRFDAKHLGRVIEHARRLKNLSRKELAKTLGVSTSVIRYWEIGKTTPPLPALKELCILFNISASEMLGLIPYEDNQQAFNLITSYASLNSEGKSEAIKRVHELSELSRYNKGDL